LGRSGFGVFGADGVSVHGGVVLGGQIAGRRHIFADDPPQGLQNIHLFQGQRVDAVEDDLPSFIYRNHAGKLSQMEGLVNHYRQSRERRHAWGRSRRKPVEVGE